MGTFCGGGVFVRDHAFQKNHVTGSVTAAVAQIFSQAILNNFLRHLSTLNNLS